jgi:hypothetical protein
LETNRALAYQIFFIYCIQFVAIPVFVVLGLCLLVDWFEGDSFRIWGKS